MQTSGDLTLSGNSVLDSTRCILWQTTHTFRYVWESRDDGAFSISEDEWNEPLGCGTEAQEYLD
ncbi:hypothetical protein OROMI_030416 [Orobanche minor]